MADFTRTPPYGAPAMEVTLTVIRGKVNRGEITFDPPAVLGRSRETDLTIAHPMISRQHCELFEVDGLLMVRDLGSLNGTVVLNRRIIESPLRPDDCFSVGPLTFQVRYQYDGDLTAIPPPKLAEPEGGKPQPAVAPVGEPAAAEPPMFSEIGPGAVCGPDKQDLPWAEALPDDRESGSAEADSNEEPAAPVPVVGASLETLPGRDAVEPTSELSAELSADENATDESDADAPRNQTQAIETRTVALNRPDTPRPESGKKKRGWRLWPFGAKRSSKGKATAPAEEEPTESPVGEESAKEEPAEEPDQAEVSLQKSETRDTQQDEAVAAFLAEDDSEDADPPAGESEADEEPEPDDEDDALQDFLKGIQ